MRTCSCLELKRAPTESPWHMRGYLCLVAGVSALAGLDAVLILEVAFQHLLALILSMGARLKKQLFWNTWFGNVCVIGLWFSYCVRQVLALSRKQCHVADVSFRCHCWSCCECCLCAGNVNISEDGTADQPLMHCCLI